MGTSGSGAGGGSGGFGGGSVGGGGGGGAITVSRKALKEIDPTEAKASAAFQAALSRLTQDYIGFMFRDAGVAAAYEALHVLHVELVQSQSWAGVDARFGVRGGRGCLRALADVLSASVHPRPQAPLHAALMDFFKRAVGGNPIVAQAGDSGEVIAALKPQIFQSTSAYFFGSYLFELLRLEDSRLTKLGRDRLREFSLRKANQVTGAFKSSFAGRPWKGRPQIGFSSFFEVLGGESEWLVAQLRKELKYNNEAQ